MENAKINVINNNFIIPFPYKYYRFPLMRYLLVNECVMKKLLITLLLVMLGIFAGAQERIQLSWDPSTDNVGVAGYRVWVDGVAIGTTTETFYILDLEPGNYDLTVSAFDAAGNESEQSYPLNVTIRDILSPTIPGVLIIKFLETTSLELQWNNSYDNYKMSGYNVYVDDELFEFTSGTYLSIQNLDPATTYKFNVSAVDAAGNESALSNNVFATTESIVIPPIETDSLMMKIYPNPNYGHFKVVLSNGIIKDNTKIQIISTNGQIIYERILPYGITAPYEEDFNLTDRLVNGTYIVALIEQNRRVGYMYIVVSQPRMYNL